MLFGRAAECAELDRLVAEARSGRSGCLVVSGTAGTGKTELLSYAQRAAAGLPILRATGVPAEQQLPFAGLHQLLRPVTHRFGDLPVPQRDALTAALALGPGGAVDPFVVAAAVLTTLADSADPDGSLVVVDDAHWLDRPSLDALLFTARRLQAEGVLLLFASRTGEDEALDGAGLPMLTLSGLRGADALALLSARAPGPVAEPVAATLVRRTEGNPLALTELAGLLDGEQLSGQAWLPDALPVGAGVERAFLTRVRALPAAAQTMLLVAAAEGGGDPGAVLAAAGRLDVPGSTLDELEAADLLRPHEGRLRFRHPLVRSAVYGAAGGAQRRGVHRALADVLTGEADADRRAWHRAAATPTVDDAVADELEACADRARRRGGYASAAACLHRSAELATQPAVRARRLVDSGRYAWLAGQPDQASASLDAAEKQGTDPALGDEIAYLRGRFAVRRGVAGDAYRILFDGADAAAQRAPGMALRMLAEATEAASLVGDVAGIVAAGRRAAAVAATGRAEDEFWRDLSVGWADMYDGVPSRGHPQFTRMLAPPDPGSPFQLVQAGTAAVYLGRSRVAQEMLYRAVQAARVGGMTGDLPYVLLFVASVEESRGRYATAQSLAEEGRRLAGDTGQVSFRCLHQATLALLAAIQGDEDTCQRLAAEVRDVALPRHLGLPAARAGLALALLDLGAGRYPQALARFEEVAQAPPGFGHPGVVMAALPDWIEAATRAGDLAAARRQLAVLEALSAVADDWTRAVLACCQALLADDDTAGALYERSLALHRAAATPPPHVARAHLLYGEWLRRTRQRSRSREHLRTAMEMYERLGARPWAARARTELRASGETLQRRDDTAGARLTPQELRIAQSVVAGQSTKDIAALLFLSPRTVEYHIYKIFPKLGVTNRAQLVRAVTERPELIDQPA